MENSTVRETERAFHGRESLKGRKISLNPSSFGSAQMGAKHELPPLETLRVKCDRIGHLKKLCGRGLLSAGTWKDRTCVLYHNQLFLYENQENGFEVGGSTGIVLDLGQLDTVTEAPTRVTRKAANVFLLGSSEKGFFDTASSRHYFAAKSLTEMKDWVSVLRSCIESERRRKELQRSTTTITTLQTTAPPPLALLHHHKDLTSEELLKMAPPSEISTLPRVSVIEPQLDCGVSKGRVKGPPGRRLPRSKKSIDTLLDEDQSESSAVSFRDDRGRATSLSALEHSKDSVDLRPEPRLSGKSPPRDLTTTNSNPNIFKFDFERAWFLKLPGEATTTSDYSSLHEDLSGDGSSDRHSSLSGGSRTATAGKEGSPASARRKDTSNRNSRPTSSSGGTTRSTCSIL